MHDEIDRMAESPEASARAGRMELSDAVRAIGLAEASIGARLVAADGEPGEVAGLLTAAATATEAGERVSVLAPVQSFAAARAALRQIAVARLPLVAHALAGHGGEELSALSDLGWCVLCASGPEDSFDLTLVARRAAEDAGAPFLVVHAHGGAHGSSSGRAHAMIALPAPAAVQTFVGPTIRRPAGASDRGIAERAPFALASALREYANASGRRHDVVDRVPLGDAPLMLVGMGPVGDALVHAVPELRARGYEVGAVNVTALRPFPGAKLVKALGRALAITVLEPADEPMTHGGLLARELKSAFTDALTWAPGFPGVGRIPKLFVGVTGASFDVNDLAAICDNMLADERGRRSFSFSDETRQLPHAASRCAPSTGNVAMRWVLDDAASAEAALAVTAAALAGALGLRAHGMVSAHPAGGGATVDVVATREHARGGMARREPRLVLTTYRGLGSAATIAPLAPGSVLGVLSPGGEPNLPDAARTLVRERRVRAVALAHGGAAEESAVAIAATCAGAALAVGSRAQRTTIDPIVVARVVAESLTARGVVDPGPAADRARRAFEATLEVLTAAELDAAAHAESA